MKVEMLQSQPTEGKKTELTHIKTNRGWSDYKNRFNIDRIVYLGKCETDGDSFAIYYGGLISFCKGHLNNGTL